MNKVVLDWLPNEGDTEWNNPLICLLEVFGLPGNRYMCRPTNGIMEITFNSEKDATLCRIMLSERLV